MTTTAPNQVVIDLDSRRRTTIRLGRHDRYRVTEHPDGTLLLEPVFELTQDELILRANPDVEASIEDALRKPETRVRRPLPAIRS